MKQIELIQTLRGLAVVLVVLGHWGLFFGNGYIGVDVFFVVSGYVVTLVSLRRADSGSFSVVRFIQARFLRLFPALGMMVLVVVGFQLLYFPSFEWSRAAEEGLWSTLWASNVYSHTRLGDYFGETAGTSLLLHTWSLAVEFQAYVILAILYFWALAKNKNLRHLQIALIVLSLTSLAIALASQFDNASNLWQAMSSYYSPLTRFYQIGAGALLATLSGYEGKARVGGLLTGAVIILGIALLPEKLVSWNLAGLAAVGGAAIFIVAAKTKSNLNLVERSLAKVGNYSYSIYLWHWPILVVAQSVFPGLLEQIVFGAGLTILFSFVSHRFFEVQFMGSRTHMGVTRAKVRAAYASAVSLCLVLVVSVSAWSAIEPVNFDSTKGVLRGDATQLGFATSFNQIMTPCSGSASEFSKNVGEIFDCYETSDSKDIDILVLGNSHAAHLIPGIVSVAPEVSLRFLSFSGGFEMGNPELRSAMDYWVTSGSRAKYLYINSFWEIESTDIGEIRKTIAISKVAPTHTYLFDDVPNFKISPVRCKYSVLFPIPAPCSEKLLKYSLHLQDFHALVYEGLHGVIFIRSSKFFEVADANYTMSDGKSIHFRDQNHLNFSGSEALFENLVKSGLLPELD